MMWETGEYFYIGDTSVKVDNWEKVPAVMGVREFYGGDLQELWISWIIFRAWSRCDLSESGLCLPATISMTVRITIISIRISEGS